MSASELFRCARDFFRAADQDRSKSHAVANDDSLFVLVIPISRKPYAELSDRARRKKKNAFQDVFFAFGLSLGEAFALLCDQWIRSQSKTETDSAHVNRALQKLSFKPSLTDIEAEALVLFRNCTRREAQFWRAHLGGFPSRHRLTAARNEILKSMPVLYVLREGSSEWDELDRPSTSMTSLQERDIISARFSLAESLTNHLTELKHAEKGPYPPYVSSISEDDRNSTVLVLISIDSGKGSLKMMARLVSTDSTQSPSEILLIAEATGCDESFASLERILSITGIEIESISTNGLVVDGRNVKVQFLMVADFKVVYSIIGCSGSASK